MTNFLFFFSVSETITGNQNHIRTEPDGDFGNGYTGLPYDGREQQNTACTQDKFCHTGYHGQYRTCLKL